MFQKSVKGFKPRTLSTYGKISAFLGYTICVLSNLLSSAPNQLFKFRVPTLKAVETCLCHSCDLYLNRHLKKSFKGLKLTTVSTHGTSSHPLGCWATPTASRSFYRQLQVDSGQERSLEGLER